MNRRSLSRRIANGALLGLGVVIVARVVSGEPFAALVAAFVAVLVVDAVLSRRMADDRPPEDGL